jgi:hypothetical protein
MTAAYWQPKKPTCEQRARACTGEWRRWPVAVASPRHKAGASGQYTGSEAGWAKPGGICGRAGQCWVRAGNWRRAGACGKVGVKCETSETLLAAAAARPFVWSRFPCQSVERPQQFAPAGPGWAGK